MNRPWLNAVAGLIVGVLLMLSGILMASTLFPRLDDVAFAGYFAAALAIGAVCAVVIMWWLGRGQPKSPVTDGVSRAISRADRSTWRMPPLTLLEPVSWSIGTRLAMLALRAYLVAGAVLLVVKAIQLSRG